jgi:hypothetical protein
MVRKQEASVFQTVQSGFDPHRPLHTMPLKLMRMSSRLVSDRQQVRFHASGTNEEGRRKAAFILLHSKKDMSANEIQHGGSHYKVDKIQVWDFIMANQIGYMEGSAIKYLARWKRKGGVEDLKKARHFIDRLIEEEEKKVIKEKYVSKPFQINLGDPPRSVYDFWSSPRF